MVTRFVLAIFLLAFVGCTHFTKEQCESFDWKSKGFAAATDGHVLEDSMAYYQKHCTDEHSVATDREEFKAGYDRGLSRFCRPSYAAQYGIKGKEYRGICEGRNEEAFLRSYTDSYLIFAKRRIAELEGNVAELESQVYTLRSEKADLESQLTNSGALTCIQ